MKSIQAIASSMGMETIMLLSHGPGGSQRFAHQASILDSLFVAELRQLQTQRTRLRGRSAAARGAVARLRRPRLRLTLQLLPLTCTAKEIRMPCITTCTEMDPRKPCLSSLVPSVR